MAGNLNLMSEWSEQLVTRFAATVRARRQHLGMSVQQVADRTEELGHPLNRSTLSDLENGRRKDRLMLGDALVLAEALRTPLAALLYPHMPDGDVEAYPGVITDSFTAAQSLTGENFALTAENEHDENEVRLLQLKIGAGLYSLSKRLLEGRETIEKMKAYLNSGTFNGDMEQTNNVLKQIQEWEDLLDAMTGQIRKYGGVVNDG